MLKSQPTMSAAHVGAAGRRGAEYFGSFWKRFEILLDELDLTPKVTVAKELHVDNPRLVMLNLVMLLCAFLFAAVFYSMKLPHLLEIPYNTNTRIHFDYDSLIQAIVWNDAENQSVCNSTAVMCSNVCTHSFQTKCVPFDQFIEQMTSEHTFIPISSTNWNLSTGRQTEPASLMYFNSKLLMVLHHSANAQGSPSMPFASATLESTSASTAATVFLDGENKVWKIFSPGEQIAVRMTDLPWLAAGSPHASSFDSLFIHAAENGGLVTAHVDCYNKLYDAVDNCHGLDQSMLTGIRFRHVCLASLKWHSVPETSSTRISSSAALDVVNIRTGIFVQGTVGSGFGRYYDAVQLIMTLATLSVIITLPNKILRIFIMVGLGQLSKIYKRGIRERFDLEERSRDLCTEMLANHKVFELLAASDAGSDGKSISWFGLKQNFKDMQKCDGIGLSRVELDHMLNFSYANMLNKGKGKHASLTSMRQEIRDILRFGADRSQFGGFGDAYLTARDYMHSVTNQGRVLDFNSINELFRSKRGVSFLERLFTPAKLHRLAHVIEGRVCESEGTESFAVADLQGVRVVDAGGFREPTNECAAVQDEASGEAGAAAMGNQELEDKSPNSTTAAISPELNGQVLAEAAGREAGGEASLRSMLEDVTHRMRHLEERLSSMEANVATQGERAQQAVHPSTTPSKIGSSAPSEPIPRFPSGQADPCSSLDAELEAMVLAAKFVRVAASPNSLTAAEIKEPQQVASESLSLKRCIDLANAARQEAEKTVASLLEKYDCCLLELTKKAEETVSALRLAQIDEPPMARANGASSSTSSSGAPRSGSAGSTVERGTTTATNTAHAPVAARSRISPTRLTERQDAVTQYRAAPRT
eukprot:TRINITY_DN12162_c0_g1_i5.p1 TRINITY_DN12162_c0_g1~~TRINITY_DN12162_c0_g1_i5.p1  ORF type:complete len:873 (-),score=133.87 TRINITY_DN12162_c0_g1_i5:235-2853(-)